MANEHTNVPWISNVVTQLPPDFNPNLPQYQVNDSQQLGHAFKMLQSKRDKLLEHQTNIDHLYKRAEIAAGDVLQCEEQLNKAKGVLQASVDQMMEAKQYYVQDVYSYSNQLQQIDKLLKEYSTKVYRHYNARLYSDYYRQLHLLLEDLAKQPTLLDTNGRDSDESSKTLQSIRNSVTEILSSVFLQGNQNPRRPINAPNQIQQTLVPTQTNHAVQVINSTELNSQYLTNGSELRSITERGGLEPQPQIPQTPRTPQAMATSLVTVQAARTGNFDIMENFNLDSSAYQPIEWDKIQYCREFSFGFFLNRPKPIPEEFENLQYHNLTITKDQVTNRLFPIVNIITEWDYINYAERFLWFIGGDVNQQTRIISVVGLIKEYRTNRLFDNFYVPHPYLIVEHRYLTSNREPPPLVTDTTQSLLPVIADNTTGQTTLVSSTEVNYIDEIRLNPCYQTNNPIAGMVDDMGLSVSRNPTHDSQYRFLSFTIALSYVVRHIIRTLLETNEHELFVQLYQNETLWDGSVWFESMIDLYGQWTQIGLADSPENPRHYRKVKIFQFTFDMNKIKNLTLLLGQVTGMVSDCSSFSEHEQLLIQNLRSHHSLNQIGLFLRDWQDISYAHPTIHVADNGHWFVMYGFESMARYGNYQAGYLETLHFAQRNPWRDYLGKVCVFDTTQVSFHSLCKRTTVVKKPGKKNATKGTPKSTVPGTPATPGSDDLRSSLSSSIPHTPVPKRGPGRPPKSKHPDPTIPAAESDPDEELKTGILKEVKSWLNEIIKEMCGYPKIQHSYLHLRIPRTNVPDAPVPLSVPPYAMLTDVAKRQVKQQFATEIQNKSHVYATDLAANLPDTFLGIYGCRDNFVEILERDGKVAPEDLFNATCKDCGRHPRLRTSPTVQKKMQNSRPCFGYIPCHCRKLTHCFRCYLLHWLWAYNNHLAETGQSSRTETALEFAVPCPNSNCGVLWRITELCLVSFDHFVTMCKFREDFPYYLESKSNQPAKKQKTNNGTAIVTKTVKPNNNLNRKVSNQSQPMTKQLARTTSEPLTPNPVPATPNSSVSVLSAKMKQRIESHTNGKTPTPQTQIQPQPTQPQPQPSFTQVPFEPQVFNFGVNPTDSDDSIDQIENESHILDQMLTRPASPTSDIMHVESDDQSLFDNERSDIW